MMKKCYSFFIIFVCAAVVLLSGCTNRLFDAQTAKTEAKIDVLMQAGDAAYQEGSYAVAKEKYQEVVTLAPKYVDGLINLGRSEVELNQFVQAQETLVQAEKQSKNNPRILAVKGKLAWKQKDLDTALACYTQAITLEPSKERLSSRAYIYRALHKNSEAIHDMEQAQKLGDTTSEGKQLLVESYIALHQFERAQTQAEALIKENPEDYLAWSALGYIELKQIPANLSVPEKKVKEQQAWEKLKRAESQGERNPAILNYVGMSYIAQASYEAAEKIYEKVATLGEVKATYESNYALVLYHLGKHDAAYTKITHAIDLDGKNPEYYVARGFISVTEGNEAPALRDFQKAYILDQGYLGKIPEAYRERVIGGIQ